MSRPLIIDSFAGGGGASEGIRAAVKGQVTCTNSTTWLRPSDHKCRHIASNPSDETLTNTRSGKLTASAVSKVIPYLLCPTTTHLFGELVKACVIVPVKPASGLKQSAYPDFIASDPAPILGNILVLLGYQKHNLLSCDVSVIDYNFRKMRRFA